MNCKHWAFFFICILSSEYVCTMASAVSRHKRQVQCRPSRRLTEVFDQCLQRISLQVDESITFDDQTVENVRLTGGTITGLKNIRRSRPITCLCLTDRIRIYLHLSFLDVTITWLVSLLDGLLGGLLGNLGRSLANLLGNVVNLVVNAVALEISLLIEIEQRFLPGSRCRVTSYRVTRISEIKVLDIDLTQLVVGLLGELLTPIFDTLVRNLLERQLRVIITREIQKIALTSDMHNCGGQLPVVGGY